MATTVTIELDPATQRELDEYRAAAGLSREQAVHQMVRGRLLAEGLQRLADQIEPYARKAGYTDEGQILREVS